MAKPQKRAYPVDQKEATTSKKVRATGYTTTATSAERKQNDQGNSYWELSAKRRVTVESFKGKTLVAIREFYEKDSKALPGKSGISLTPEQFWVLACALPDIKQVLKSKGETEDGNSDDDDDDDDDDNGNKTHEEDTNKAAIAAAAA